MKLQVIALLLALLCSVASSESSDNTCSYAEIMVMTKEEMKREIKRQFQSSGLLDGHGNKTACSCNSYDALKLADKIEENLSSKLEKLFFLSLDKLQANFSEMLDQTIQPVLNRLNMLHQPGKSPSHPAVSCKEIYDYNPNTPSGRYWIEVSNGKAVSKFCDMTRTCGGVTGGWMQVTKLDMRNSGSRCPSGLRERVHPTKRLCGMGIDGGGCSQVNFANNGICYNQVCGKVIAYQFGSTDSFGQSRVNRIDGNYVDGVSLTHGSPRKHIWTFAAALDEVGTAPFSNCPCTNVHSASRASHPPSFVGNNYFCDTSSIHRYQNNHLYAEDPLWDGAGCGSSNTCCSLNNPPWFFKQLPSDTRDNIEMRVCCNQNRVDEDIRIEEIELYVR